MLYVRNISHRGDPFVSCVSASTLTICLQYFSDCDSVNDIDMQNFT